MNVASFFGMPILNIRQKYICILSYKPHFFVCFETKLRQAQSNSFQHVTLQRYQHSANKYVLKIHFTFSVRAQAAMTTDQ